MTPKPRDLSRRVDHANPDLTLETIHRNAGEIARFAEFIRKGHTPCDWRKHENYTGKKV